MNGLLIHDISSTADRNTAAPSNPLPGGDNPIHLPLAGAFHGGVWRGAFRFDTIGPAAATAVYLKTYAPHLLAISAAVASIIYVPDVSQAVGSSVAAGFLAFSS